MSKSRKSIVTLALSFLIAFCVALVPIRTMAAETYGYVGTFTGDLQFVSSMQTIPLTFAYSNVEHYEDGTINKTSKRATYKGKCSFWIQLNGDTGSYINGLVFSTYTFNSLSPSSGLFTISLDNDTVEGVDLSIGVATLPYDKAVYQVNVDFHNYEITSSLTYIPIVFDITYTVPYSLDTEFIPNTFSVSVTGDEWRDLLVQYDDVRDLPGYYGDSSRQNQQIIDSIDENTSAVNDAASYIGNKIQYYTDLLEKSIVSSFNALTTNLSNWYNGLISNLNTNFDRLLNQNNDEHEETINGYQGSDTPAADEAFTAGAGELTSAEENLTYITDSNIDNYTTAAFDTSVIATLGPSLVYVVTWFTNFWNMGGLFTAILNIGLALAVAFYILRVRGR